MKYIFVGVMAVFAVVGVAEAARTIMPVGEAQRFATVNAEVDADVYRFFDDTYQNVCYYTIYQKNAIPEMDCVHVGE